MSQSQDDRRNLPLLDGLIDRLVDGELDEAARADVLGRLDAEPAGWRRCALAFLEAQAWREALSAGARGGTLPVESPSEPLRGTDEPLRVDSSRRERVGRNALRSTLSLAATVLIAFAAGWLANASSRAVAPSPPAAPGLVRVQRTPLRSTEPVPSSTAEVDEPRDGPDPAMVPVSLAEPEDGPEEMGLSGPLREQLEQRGYRLEHRRGLMSMDLRNGRTLAVPVDEVELRYVGNRVY